MRKVIVCMSMVGFLFFFVSFSSAGDLPNPPKNCFVSGTHCYETVIFQDKLGRDVINLSFFAHIHKSDFESHDDIIERFIDFESWPSYVEDSEHIFITESRRFFPHFSSDTTWDVVWQKIDFSTLAPWPLRRMRVSCVLKYSNCLMKESTKCNLELDHNFDAVGVRNMHGVMSLSKTTDDEENYLAYVSIKILPEIEILTSLAIPYIENGLVSVFEGMFDL